MELKKKGKDFSGKIKTWVKNRKEKRAERSIIGMPVIRVGPDRKLILVLWGVLLFSLAFAVYKNFTAIDREIIREREVVEERVKDTNRAENFIRRFAEIFYSWGYDTASKDERLTAASGYLTEDLVKLNRGTISSECPTASEVLSTDIWEVEETENDYLRVTYSVRQKLTEASGLTGQDEGRMNGQTQETGEKVTIHENFYQTDVFVGDDGSMVIVKNPTAVSAPEKASHRPAEKKSDGTVSTAEQSEIKDFFNTFFTLYPSAAEKELTYYMDADTLGVISRNLVYDGLADAAFYKEDGKIMAHVCVRYLDQTAKMTEIPEYTFIMEKGDNWRIAGVR